ncbi:hypothetical protein JTB14_017016 [Gonioctena quinquepunctata]|nr:hypothetical protein JTB14_017016 [Gonioctena quinquepunctata]
MDPQRDMITNNTGRIMTIYDIPHIVRTALPLRTATPNNIIAGFKVSGIFSFNKYIFQDREFSAGYATDHQQPSDVIADDDDPIMSLLVQVLNSSNSHCFRIFASTSSYRTG